jgi:KaiC/GvpD/RAD55 family RecA-like ATPase
VTSRSGDTGAGKALFGWSSLVRGARGFAEAGVLLSFEESDAELAMNVAVEQIRDQAEIALR